MTGMSDREKAFENKFVHDEEMRFKAIARRNKLFGLWPLASSAGAMRPPMPGTWSPPMR